MKTVCLLMLLSLGVTAQTTKPYPQDHAVYGSGKSLIGIIRYWNPSYFYPLHPAYYKFIHPLDKDFLCEPRRIDTLLYLRYGPVKRTDTLYQPFKLNEK